MTQPTPRLSDPVPVVPSGGSSLGPASAAVAEQARAAAAAAAPPVAAVAAAHSPPQREIGALDAEAGDKATAARQLSLEPYSASERSVVISSIIRDPSTGQNTRWELVIPNGQDYTVADIRNHLLRQEAWGDAQKPNDVIVMSNLDNGAQLEGHHRLAVALTFPEPAAPLRESEPSASGRDVVVDIVEPTLTMSNPSGGLQDALGFVIPNAQEGTVAQLKEFIRKQFSQVVNIQHLDQIIMVSKGRRLQDNQGLDGCSEVYVAFMPPQVHSAAASSPAGSGPSASGEDRDILISAVVPFGVVRDNGQELMIQNAQNGTVAQLKERILSHPIWGDGPKPIKITVSRQLVPLEDTENLNGDHHIGVAFTFAQPAASPSSSHSGITSTPVDPTPTPVVNERPQQDDPTRVRVVCEDRSFNVYLKEGRYVSDLRAAILAPDWGADKPTAADILIFYPNGQQLPLLDGPLAADVQTVTVVRARHAPAGRAGANIAGGYKLAVTLFVVGLLALLFGGLGVGVDPFTAMGTVSRGCLLGAGGIMAIAGAFGWYKAHKALAAAAPPPRRLQPVSGAATPAL